MNKQTSVWSRKLYSTHFFFRIITNYLWAIGYSRLHLNNKQTTYKIFDIIIFDENNILTNYCLKSIFEIWFLQHWMTRWRELRQFCLFYQCKFRLFGLNSSMLARYEMKYFLLFFLDTVKTHQNYKGNIFVFLVNIIIDDERRLTFDFTHNNTS